MYGSTIPTPVKESYVPPSFIYSVIEGNDDELSPPAPKKKSLAENIRSILPFPNTEEIPSPKSLEDSDGEEDSEDDDESEDESEVEKEMKIDEQPPPQQLKDRLISLMNLYLNDKHYELRDEIVGLTDNLYNLKQLTQEKRQTIFELIDKVLLQEEEKLGRIRHSKQDIDATPNVIRTYSR